MIYNILAAILFAYFIIEALGLPMKIKKLFKIPAKKRLKPLDCMYCLSSWTGLLLYFLPLQVSYIVITMLGAGYVSEFLENDTLKKIIKIKKK